MIAEIEAIKIKNAINHSKPKFYVSNVKLDNNVKLLENCADSCIKDLETHNTGILLVASNNKKLVVLSNIPESMGDIVNSISWARAATKDIQKNKGYSLIISTPEIRDSIYLRTKVTLNFENEKLEKYLDFVRNNKLLVLLLLAVLYLLYKNINANKQITEGLDASSSPGEAIANVASIYNKAKMDVTELSVTQNAAVTGNLTVNGAINFLPKGVIVAWTGTTAPAGWALCNGQNGTPDLRGRFIYGLGGGRGATINARGGLETVALTVAQMHSHSHRVIPYGDDNGWCKHGCKLQGSDRNNNDNYTAGNQNTEAAGGNQPHENMPSYHVLAYIMKL